MAIIRVSTADIDREKLLAELAARPQPSEEEIERQAAEDGDAWTDEELANAVPVYPPPKPDEIRALRTRIGLSQSQFALMFGFNVDTWQQYRAGTPRPIRTRVHPVARHRERARGRATRARSTSCTTLRR